jgi:hypothetical protein
VNDHRDDLTDALRRALHRDSAAGSRRADEDVLARVHAGARRRRVRRTAAVGAVGALAAGTVLAVAQPLAERDAELAASRLSGASDLESSAESGTASSSERVLDPLLPRGASRSSTPVDPTDVRARAVTASGPEESWLLGDADCGRTACVVIGRTEGADGATTQFHVGPGLPGADMTLRMAANGEDGWVLSDGVLYATHDSAGSWAAVEAPMATVEDVVTSGSSVWVTGEKDGETVVATAPVTEDALQDAELPRDLGRPAEVSEPVITEAAGGEGFGFLREGDGAATFVAYDDATGWDSHKTANCRETSSLSGSSTALWAICTTAQGVSPMVSADGGLTWDLVEVDKDVGDDPSIAAIDRERAFIHNGIELYLAIGGEMDRVDPPSEGAGSKRYDYLGFVDVNTGFLIDSDGVLSRSDSGGFTWEPVDLP